MNEEILDSSTFMLRVLEDVEERLDLTRIGERYRLILERRRDGAKVTRSMRKRATCPPVVCARKRRDIRPYLGRRSLHDR